MALPLILGALGSGLAGAGALGSLGILASPLIAGSIGAGLGSAIETGDIREGIKTGLTAGALGALGGAIVGGGAGMLPPAGAPAVQGVGATGAAGGAGAAAGGAGAAAPTGIRGMLSSMPRGFAPVTEMAGSFSSPSGFAEMARAGLNQGVLSGAGVGTMVPGLMQAMTPEMPEVPEAEYIPEAGAANRRRYIPGRGYRPGYEGEFLYFDPTPPAARFANGGMIGYKPMGMQEPVYMQAGGIADAMPGAEMIPQMNDKDIVQNAIRAVKGELAEEEAAIVLGLFLEQYGEEALRRLVSDVRTGKADGERGDVEGMVEGPGDGMDDFVPAEMDDGSQDVLLSDGEFVVPADVVSGLGNGSTDAGAEELYGMMDRVRRERTGTTEQPDQVKVGGLLPA